MAGKIMKIINNNHKKHVGLVMRIDKLDGS